MLVVTFCSFLTGECPVQFYDDSIYENWSSCMKEGISKSKDLIEGIDEEAIKMSISHFHISRLVFCNVSLTDKTSKCVISFVSNSQPCVE